MPPLFPISTRALWAEFIGIFVLFPALLAISKPQWVIYITLWVMACAAYAILRKYHNYHFIEDWNLRAVKAALLYMCPRLAALATALFIFAWLDIPERLFNFPLERPQRWLVVMLLYPLLSAFPQEFIFRSFFFRRYAPLFSPHNLMIASALAFGWAHIVLQNWVAVTFAAIGGYIFARTYQTTRSLAAASLEHALYGCWIFTLGLGLYFYYGQAVK